MEEKSMFEKFHEQMELHGSIGSQERMIRKTRIDPFLATVDLSVRKPENTELVDGNDAVRYNQACDYPENSDYGLIVEALKAGPGVAGKLILEIGSGPGNLCQELINEGADAVVGADPSREMTRHASDRFRDVRGIMAFVSESVYNLPKELYNTFDLAVSQNTFHQLHNPKLALAGMVDATKSGGEVHIFDFRRDIPLELLARRIAYTKPEIWRDFANSVCAALTKQEFREVLSQIPGIDFLVTDARNPAELSDRARKLIRLDPVPHHLDYLVSQKVTIYKR